MPMPIFLAGSGLPDGIFSNQKSKFGYFLRVLQWKMLYFYGHLFYFTAIWQTLWTFGTVCGNLVYSLPFWVCCTKKNLATLSGPLKTGKRIPA
jgi:hypothetical protein